MNLKIEIQKSSRKVPCFTPAEIKFAIKKEHCLRIDFNISYKNMTMKLLEKLD